MGDSRGEGERNFWNGKEAVTMKGPKSEFKPLNVQVRVSSRLNFAVCLLQLLQAPSSAT